MVDEKGINDKMIARTTVRRCPESSSEMLTDSLSPIDISVSK